MMAVAGFRGTRYLRRPQAFRSVSPPNTSASTARRCFMALVVGPSLQRLEHRPRVWPCIGTSRCVAPTPVCLQVSTAARPGHNPDGPNGRGWSNGLWPRRGGPDPQRSTGFTVRPRPAGPRLPRRPRPAKPAGRLPDAAVASSPSVARRDQRSPRSTGRPQTTTGVHAINGSSSSLDRRRPQGWSNRTSAHGCGSTKEITNKEWGC